MLWKQGSFSTSAQTPIKKYETGERNMYTSISKEVIIMGEKKKKHTQRKKEKKKKLMMYCVRVGKWKET